MALGFSLPGAKLNSGQPHTVGVCVSFLPSPARVAAELKGESVLGRSRRLPLSQTSPDQIPSSWSLDNVAEKPETDSPASRPSQQHRLEPEPRRRDAAVIECSRQGPAAPTRV